MLGDSRRDAWDWRSTRLPPHTRRCSIAKRGGGRSSSTRMSGRRSSATRSSYRARFERLATLADIVKLSDDDAAWIYPELELADVLERILGLGPRLVAITMGTARRRCGIRDGYARVPAVPVTVVGHRRRRRQLRRCAPRGSGRARRARAGSDAVTRRRAARGSGRVRGDRLRDHVHANGSRPAVAGGDRRLDRKSQRV